jgi:hypothetical protein
MHMQRKWSSGVLFSLLFTLLLAACSSGGGDSAAPVVPAGTAEGLWTGTLTDSLNGQHTLRGAVLDDGTYWFLYSAVGNPTLMQGTLQGNGSTSNGTFASLNGLDFNNEHEEKFPVTVTGSYVMQQNLGGTLKYSGPIPLTFTSTFNSENSVTPVIANVVGSYTGKAFGFDHTITVSPPTVPLSDNITVTTSGGPHRTGLEFDGGDTGIQLGCDFTGILSPRSQGGNMYDITLTPTINAFMCALGPFTGVAFLMPTTARRSTFWR